MIRIFNRIQREGMKARMILQVHDELNFDVPVNEIEQLKRLVTEEMQQAYKLRVPLIADSGIADNWLEAH